MSDLQIAPARQPSSAPAVIVSALVLASVAASIFYFNPHKISEFKVNSVDIYAPSTTFGSLDGPPAANGTHVLGAASTSTETNLYVIAHVSVTDKLRYPLLISGATAHATLADGTELESNLLSATDLKRLEVIFPDIGHHALNPITDGEEIAPGQTRLGTIVLPFPGQTAEAWKTKTIATLTLDLHDRDPQTTALP